MKTLHNQSHGASLQGVSGPAWDLSPEYASFSAKNFSEDLQSFETLMKNIDKLGTLINNRVPDAASHDPAKEKDLLEQCRQFAVDFEKAVILRANLGTYANCVASTDGSNADAKRTRSMLVEKGAVMSSASAGVFLVLKLCPDAFFHAFCALPGMASFRFMLEQERKLRNQALPDRKSVV